MPPIPTRDGAEVASIDAPGGPYSARLLTYVPGHPLDEVLPQTATLETALGHAVASVDRELGNLEDPTESGDREMVWDPRGAAGLIREQLDAVSAGLAVPTGMDGAPDGRDLIEDVLAAVEEIVAPRAAALPISLIHNDAHGDNVRVDAGSATRPAASRPRRWPRARPARERSFARSPRTRAASR